jgi:hypothetical protein
MIVPHDINSHMSSLVPFKAVFETSPIFTVIGAGPTTFLVFLVSESIYFRIIGICCHDISNYQTFQTALYQQMGNIGNNLNNISHNVSESASNTMAIARICFWDPGTIGDSAASSVHRTDNQASLPPPYWVSPLFFDCALSHLILD